MSTVRRSSRRGSARPLWWPNAARCERMVPDARSPQSVKYQKRGSVLRSSFKRKTCLCSSTQRISESGSSRLPNTRAPVGQASTHDGSRPCRVRWMQKVHFSDHALLARAIAEVMLVGIDFRCRHVGGAPVEATRPVRARCHAIAAPDAPVVVNHHDAIGLLPGGADGADTGARRVGTLEALRPQVEVALGRDFVLEGGIAEIES